MTQDQILAEIRRTATTNGGVPLGVARFFAETGIKETDWRGKYWVRWGDAVRAAGFEPNVLNTAIPDHVLLEHLRDVVQRLGHFPVVAELKIEARSNPAFPSPKVFNRFGGKAAIAARLEAFCRECSDATVAEICASVAVSSESTEAPMGPTADVEFGFVYLLKAGRFYKVGCTNAVGRRERELAIQLPEKANVVHSIRTDDPAGIEAYWHRRFAGLRRNGEWFDLTQAEVGAFKRRKFM